MLGWKPGWSTDYDAVIMAKNISADAIINMSNIDYVYDSDPKKNRNAKKLNQSHGAIFENWWDKWVLAEHAV